MSVSQPRVGGPWYLYFWPWFIVSLLGLSVLGSLSMVVIAYRHRDVDVRELAHPTAPAPQTTAPIGDLDSAVPGSRAGPGERG